MYCATRAIGLILALIAFAHGLAESRHAAAATLTANSQARYGSGNTTIGEDDVSGFALPHDGSTGIQRAENTHLATAATAKSNLSNAAIGGASAWQGASVIDAPMGNGGTRWNLHGSTLTRFDDSITVNSASLPVGTPVQIGFSLHVASSFAFSHTVPISSLSNNYTGVNADVGLTITTPGIDPYHLSRSDNRMRHDTTSEPNIVVGLLDPATPHLNFTYNAHVGDVMRFLLDVRTTAHGRLTPFTVSTFPQLVLENAFGDAISGASVAFGATAQTAGVTLDSDLFNDAFPAASQANATNAALGLPANPLPVSLAADLEPDGDVDGNDFLLIQRTDPALTPTWESQFGSGVAIGTAEMVPEPTTWLLSFGAGVFALQLRFRHTRWGHDA